METDNLLRALCAGSSSVRLQAALTIGTDAAPGMVDILIERCSVEPDFYVREMLTWALTRFPSDATVPRLVECLGVDHAQTRSQSLHTLSKIGDTRAWPAISDALLRAPDDDVARSAWRAAVILVPDEDRRALAGTLATQLGRGTREVQRSLSRALIALGDVVIEPLLQTMMASDDPKIRDHAGATQWLLHDPKASFEVAMHEAKRTLLMRVSDVDPFPAPSGT